MNRFLKIFVSLAFVVIISLTAIVGVINRGTGGSLTDIFKLKDFSTLEGRYYQTCPELTLESFTNASFQNQLERFVADQVPDRDDVLVDNATLQRSTIALAGGLVGYDIYPTFYGSGYVYDAADDLITPLALKHTATLDTQYNQLAEKLNAFLKKYSSIPTTVCNVDQRDYSTTNPTRQLMSNTIAGNYIQEHFFDRLPGTVKKVNLAVDDEKTYEKDYFRSDHHWNMYGAYKGYVKTLATLDPDAKPVKVNRYFTWDVPYYGSYSRSGLCKINKPDNIVDVDYDASNLKVTVNLGYFDDNQLVHKDLYKTDSVSKDEFLNQYADYFHNDYEIIQIDNPSCKNGKTLVMVADSYSDCNERLFAENYSTVYVLDPRFYRGTLSSFLKDHGDVDDLLFFMGPANYLGQATLDFLSLG